MGKSKKINASPNPAPISAQAKSSPTSSAGAKSKKLVLVAKLPQANRPVLIGEIPTTLDQARIVFENWLITEMNLENSIAPAHSFPSEVFLDSNSLSFDEDQSQTIESINQLSSDDLHSFDETLYEVDDLITPAFIARIKAAHWARVSANSGLNPKEKQRRHQKYVENINTFDKAVSQIKQGFLNAPCPIHSSNGSEIRINLGTILMMANGGKIRTNFRIGAAEAMCNTLNRCDDLNSVIQSCQTSSDTYITLLYSVTCAGKCCHGDPNLDLELAYSIYANLNIWTESPIGLSIGLFGLQRDFNPAAFEEFGNFCITHNFPPTAMDINLWRALSITSATDHQLQGDHFHYDKLFCDKLVWMLNTQSEKKFWSGPLDKLSRRLEKWLSDIFFRSESALNARFDHEILTQMALGITRNADSTHHFNTMGLVTKDSGVQKGLNLLAGLSGDANGLYPIKLPMESSKIAETIEKLGQLIENSPQRSRQLSCEAFTIADNRLASSIKFRDSILELIQEKLFKRASLAKGLTSEDVNTLKSSIPSMIDRVKIKLSFHDQKVRTLSDFAKTLPVIVTS